MSILDDTNVTVAHGELRDLLGTGSSSHDTTKSQRSSKDGRTTSMENSASPMDPKDRRTTGRATPKDLKDERTTGTNPPPDVETARSQLPLDIQGTVVGVYNYLARASKRAQQTMSQSQKSLTRALSEQRRSRPTSETYPARVFISTSSCIWFTRTNVPKTAKLSIEQPDSSSNRSLIILDHATLQRPF